MLFNTILLLLCAFQMEMEYSMQDNAGLDFILSWGIMHLFFCGGSTGFPGSPGALGKERRDQKKNILGSSSY